MHYDRISRVYITARDRAREIARRLLARASSARYERIVADVDDHAQFFARPRAARFFGGGGFRFGLMI